MSKRKQSVLEEKGKLETEEEIEVESKRTETMMKKKARLSSSNDSSVVPPDKTTAGYEHSSSTETLENVAQRILQFCSERHYNTEPNRFFEELIASRISEDGKVLKIETNDRYPGEYPRFPKEVYIQDQYKDMYNIIQDLLSQNHHQRFRDIIVLGHPGVGNTIFGLYYMWKIVMSEDSFFMYEDSKDMIQLYLPGSAIVLNRIQARSLCKSFPDQIIYLVDLVEKNNEPYAGLRYKYAVCFTSPNPSKYECFAKGDGAKIIYMKRPEIKEVKEMWRTLSSYHHIEEKIIDQQIKWYGPIPRYVLLDSKHGEDFILRAITVKGDFACRTLIQKDFRLDDLSHILIHLDSQDHFNYHYRAASTSVVKQLMDHHRFLLSQSLLSYMTDPYSMFNSLAGDVLDILAPWELLPRKDHILHPLPGHRMYGERVNAITTTEDINLNLIETRKLPHKWSKNDSFTPAQNVYYTQSSRIKKSIDGFVIENNRLFLFQITVATTHSVLGNELNEVIRKIQAKYREELRVFLVFVTAASDPTKRIGRIQALHNDERINYTSVKDIPKRIQGLASEQYVLHLNL